MKALIQKDKNTRRLFSRTEKKKKLLKYLVSNCQFPFSFRLQANLRLFEDSSLGSIAKTKKRCCLTGRSRFLLGKFNLSRLSLRKLAGRGLIPFIKLSSW